MNRVNTEERKEFHELLDMCLDKLENPKNNMKPHWESMSIKEIRDLIMIECYELNHAMNIKSISGIKSEARDIINYSMFILYNLKRLLRIK